MKEYKKGNLTVVWQPKKCIHSGICVMGLGSVFKPKEKPWINLDGAEDDLIRQQVRQCPSGALSIKDDLIN